MALSQTALKSSIKDILTANLAETKKTPSEMLDGIANQLATVITDYIKTATITTTIVVAPVTGACATPAGPGTITGTTTATATHVIS